MEHQKRDKLFTSVKREAPNSMEICLHRNCATLDGILIIEILLSKILCIDGAMVKKNLRRYTREFEND